ncbi:transglycosylase domain-containing protein [Actinosynnema sp. NPDC059335]|uniref:transglycosylase domain-containing protein n=1 Tax=Actinosynnema sp. NPDC059335 TaxID=3346804 RepID=UPI00367095B8
MPDGPAAAGSVPGGPPQRPNTPPGGLRRPGGPGGPVPPGGRPPVGGPGGPRRPGGPGGQPPRRPGEEPTDLLPPVYQTTPREPELLTHREDEVELEPFYDDEYDEELTEEEARAVRRKKLWRRVRRTAYVAFGLMLLAPVVAFAIAYQVVEVPNPEAVAADQNKAITILYADGTEMAKIAPDGANRTLVKAEDIPDTIKHAIMAAEDPTFETNPGFDLRSIARAAWYQVTDRESGGSGLTQQYVKKATDKDQETISRKFNEMVIAYKMSQQQDKDAIMTAYLNTIYFGRSAYGIKTAVKEYFGLDDLNQVTYSQAALLAGMIQNPGKSENPTYREDRWNYVMNQLLNFGWIDQQYRTTEPVAVPIDITEKSGLSGPRLHIREQVLQEMESEKVNWGQEKSQQLGVTVHTTIDPPKQQAAEDAVREIMGPQPKELRSSLSAIDPQTGAVLAYYAGEDGTGLDYARNTLQEAGSSFKPFDLVAALKAGKGLGSTYDGRSPKKFDLGGTSITIRNASDPSNSCGEKCPIREAMRMSLNTVFYEMVIEIGTQPVADAAHAAGIPKTVEVQGTKKDLLVNENGGAPNVGIAIGGGEAQVRPFDMASAYATFAARGTYHEPFFISKITNSEGKAVYQHVDVSRQAFDPDPQMNQDIADNVTESLKPVLTYSKIPCAGRECAGKTGTHELPDDASQNSKAWMVGYTPSLSASVWVGRDEGNVALKDAKGNPVFGGGLPGQIWKKFMDKALEGTPPEPFPKARKLYQFDNPKPTTTAPPTTTTPKEDENRDNPPTTTEPTRQSTTTTTPTRPTRPCGIVGCPTGTTTSDENEPPNPIGNGAPPTG